MCASLKNLAVMKHFHVVSKNVKIQFETYQLTTLLNENEMVTKPEKCKGSLL